MSSRHRRSMTLKHFDALYRSGRKQSVPISMNRPLSTPQKMEEDTQAGSPPSETGTPEVPNNGPGPRSYSILDTLGRYWDERRPPFRPWPPPWENLRGVYNNDVMARPEPPMSTHLQALIREQRALIREQRDRHFGIGRDQYYQDMARRCNMLEGLINPEPPQI